MLAVVLAIVTGSSGAAYAVPAQATSDPVVTRDQAQQVVADWYAKSYQAAAGLDSALLAETESPPLLTIDEGDFQYRRAEEKPFEGLIEEPGKTDIFVPRQTTYPAQFLARVGYPGGLSQFFVFVRGSADSAWRTPYQAATDSFPKLPSPIAVDRSGYAQLVPPGATKLKVGLDDVSKRLVDYFSKYRSQSLPAAKPFRDGPATSDNLKAIRARSREVDAAYTFAVASSPPAVYRTKDGGALTFFAYSSQEQANAPRGGTLRVQSGGLPGPQLAPGRYASTDTTRLTLLAAVVPPAKKKQALVTVVGRYTGTLSVSGTPEGPTDA